MNDRITMIGTGHVFNIAEPVSFIVKHIWPQAVLVELDDRRYKVLTGEVSPPTDTSGIPKIYKRSARYQDKVSADNKTQTGGEILAAINTGKLVGADIVCIDDDAEKVIMDMWAEMSFSERFRYSISVHTDNLFRKRKVDKTQKEFSANEEEYMADMRRRYPTFVRKLVDERNEHMATRIREAAGKYESIIVVVGDAHVEGLCGLLNELQIRKIRLSQLMNQDEMDKVRDEVWNEGESE